jgi:hypothetical protein
MDVQYLPQSVATGIILIFNRENRDIAYRLQSQPSFRFKLRMLVKSVLYTLY